MSDPSDWDHTRVPQLREIDALSRCYICKEFFTAPVLTSCNHTFCSQCIRALLIVKQQCPLCKAELFETNLARNILLEEIVRSFATVRRNLIEAVGKKEASTSDPEIIEVLDGDDITPPTLRNSPQIRSLPVSGTQKHTTNTRHLERSLVNHTQLDRQREKNVMSQNGDTLSVQCPICSEHMSAMELQGKHIDECLLRQERPKRKRQSTGITSFFKKRATPMDAHSDFYFKQVEQHHSTEKRLPKLDFQSLTTAKMKEKLAAVKIPTTGTRQQLELRYNHYYVLYNANLDSNHPESESTLRQRLHEWEVSLKPKQSLFGRRMVMISDKDFLRKAWFEEHKREYRRLVREAKRGKKEEVKKEEVEQREVEKREGRTTWEERVEDGSTNVKSNEAVNTIAATVENGENGTHQEGNAPSSPPDDFEDMGSSFLFDNE